MLLTQDFPPMDGGIARWMAEFARRSPPSSLVVSTGSMPETEAFDATIPQEIQRVPVRARRLRTVQGMMLWSHHAAMLARSRKVPFIWCGHPKPAAYPARWIHSRQGTPYGIIAHGTDLILLQHKVDRSPLQRRAARSLLSAAALFVTNSRYTAELCRRVLTNLGFAEGRHPIHVVPLGADRELFRPGIDPRAAKKKYGLNSGRWMMTVARLVAHKGVDTVLRALALLKDEYPELHYAVIGTGDREDAFRQMAVELGVADRVRFLGFVPEPDLPGLLNGAELYVHTSRDTDRMIEGFGIAIVEASACGIPVIVGNTGGMPDAVREGESGIIADSEDPESVAREVKRLLDDRDLRLRLGAGGRKAVDEFYNWDRVVSAMWDIERGALDGAPRAGRSSRGKAGRKD